MLPAVERPYRDANELGQSGRGDVERCLQGGEDRKWQPVPHSGNQIGRCVNRDPHELGEFVGRDGGDSRNHALPSIGNFA